MDLTRNVTTAAPRLSTSTDRQNSLVRLRAGRSYFTGRVPDIARTLSVD